MIKPGLVFSDGETNSIWRTWKLSEDELNWICTDITEQQKNRGFSVAFIMESLAKTFAEHSGKPPIIPKNKNLYLQ